MYTHRKKYGHLQCDLTGQHGHPAEAKMEDFRFMQWLAGQVDGDGSVGVINKSKTPFITIKKAEKGSNALRLIERKVGGSLYKSGPEIGNFQAKYIWYLRGGQAVPLAKKLIPYLKIKRRQATAIAAWTSQYHRFSVLSYTQDREEEEDAYRCQDISMEEVAAIVYRTPRTILKCMRANKTCNGFVVTRESGTAVEVQKEILSLKGLPDEAVDWLHPSYIAGFFDAEGHIKTQKSSLYATISQKDPAILRPIHRTYGGAIYSEKNRTMYCLTFCGPSARAFLMAIRQDVYEKRNQLELALQLNRDNWQELGPQMKAMRGCQLKKKPPARAG